MEGRMDVDQASVFVVSDLNLNWWSCGHCGFPSQLILGDLQWAVENFPQS